MIIGYIRSASNPVGMVGKHRDLLQWAHDAIPYFSLEIIREKPPAALKDIVPQPQQRGCQDEAIH